MGDLSRFPEEARPLLDAATKLLLLYMPGHTKEIEMLVAPDTKATLRFASPFPVTQEMIDNCIDHLLLYKKYFPKAADAPVTPPISEILREMAEKWEQRAQPPVVKGDQPA